MNLRCRAICLVALALFGWAKLAHADDSVTELPRQILDLAIADSGKLLVIQLADEDVLRIYDPVKGDFVGKVDTQSAECVFGAGGSSLVFFRPNDSVLESWDLRTLTRMESIEFFDPGPILRIVMGNANGYEFFIRATTGSGALDRTVLQLIDARTLRPISGQIVGTTGHNRSYRDFVHYRADCFLSKISEWSTSGSPSGVGLLVRRDRDFETYYEHDSAGYLAMCDDGNIYTETGKVLSNNPKPNPQHGNRNSLVQRGSIPRAKPFPAIGGIFVLGVSEKDTLYLFEASSKKRIAEVGELPGGFMPKPSKDDENRQGPRQAYAEQWAKTTFTLDRRIIFAPQLGYVAFVPYTNDRVIVRQFNLEQVIKNLDGSVLYFTSAPVTQARSGQDWRYDVKAISNAEPFEIVLAVRPEGMEITDEGSITWKIPGGIRGTADVTLKVSDAAGNTKQQRFTISFR